MRTINNNNKKQTIGFGVIWAIGTTYGYLKVKNLEIQITFIPLADVYAPGLIQTIFHFSCFKKYIFE
jgi:hypothetical protein